MLMVFWSTLLEKKLFEVKFNGMVSLRILHLVMIKGEQTVMMMLIENHVDGKILEIIILWD